MWQHVAIKELAVLLIVGPSASTFVSICFVRILIAVARTQATISEPIELQINNDDKSE